MPVFSRLHIEPVGGVAGDMLLGGLVDLGAERGAIDAALASLAHPGLTLGVERVTVNGVPACCVRSLPRDDAHGHRHLHEILELLARAEMSARARTLAETVFTWLAEAEGASHGAALAEVALHEVGQLDSVLDVVGIAVALDGLGLPKVSSSPLPSGHGTVHTAHGVLTCPVPAVRELARRAKLPLVDVDVEGETVTPTGAAVLAAVCQRFGPTPLEPAAAVGVGAGTRRFVTRPNIVRVLGFVGAVDGR